MAEPLGERLLGDLPQLGPDDELRFACHPGVPCFNACCADLDLLLSPYDAWRLRRALALDGIELVERYTRRARDLGTGFPLLYLAMVERPGRPCPFVRPQGCSVYADRPSACRAYPLGRGTRLGPSGEVLETFVLVEEPHCWGFAEPTRSSPRRYVVAQGLEPYNHANDQFMRLLAAWQDTGRVLNATEADLVFTALYCADDLGARLSAAGEAHRAATFLTQLANDDESSLASVLTWLHQRLGV